VRFTAPRRACACLLLTAALLAGASLGGRSGPDPVASASAAEAGVNLNTLELPSLAQATALGGHWVRVFAPWSFLEPARGEHSAFWLPRYARLLSSLPKGTKAIVDFVDTPSWESGSAATNAPPANPADYAAALHYLAQRWAGHVAAYEIWNEEDTPLWWAGAPDPAAYTRLLQAAYPAVKSADPTAAVVLGGLTGNDYNFLEGVYQSGGKGYFNAVGVHTDTACAVGSPYTFVRDADGRLDPDSFLAYREVHATELANGDNVPIWMTEMSWRTTTARCTEGAFAGMKPQGVSDAQQATYLSQAYHCLAGNPYVQLALWYPIDDEGAVDSGLLRTNRSRKPSYAAMRSYIRHGDRVRGACGNFTGPKISVSSPFNRISYSGPLPIHVSARSSAGVFRIRLEIDGKLIRNYEGPRFPSFLSGTLDWQGAKHIAYGRHTLTILAYDKQRNVSRVSITIYHRPPKHQRAHG
jgi:hypothetical protein